MSLAHHRLFRVSSWSGIAQSTHIFHSTVEKHTWSINVGDLKRERSMGQVSIWLQQGAFLKVVPLSTKDYELWWSSLNWKRPRCWLSHPHEHWSHPVGMQRTRDWDTGPIMTWWVDFARTWFCWGTTRKPKKAKVTNIFITNTYKRFPSPRWWDISFK